MLKKIGTFLFVMTCGFLFSVTAYASDSSYGLTAAAKKANYNSNQADVYKVVGTAVQTVLAVTGFVFLGYMIYAGLRWMTAKGNDELITKSKETIKSTVTGLIIIFIAYAVTAVVLNLLNS